ncbi:MAG: ROK family protein, partial [Candidatus Hydrogenedentes bacterium]|nr:ROK family protein [Candidatus Hydrogenedentota bacterium]
MAEALLGIDLGGTLVKTALVSRDKKILSKDARPTRAHEGLDVVLDVIAASVEAVLADAGHAREEVLAACIGAPGPSNPHTGVVFSPPNLPGWKDVPLAELMTERL